MTYVSVCNDLAQKSPLAPSTVYDKGMKKTNHPQGPFGELRPLNLVKTSEAKLLRFHCYGWLDKVAGQWELNARGRDLFYLV